MIDLNSLAPVLLAIGAGVTILPFLDRDSTSGRLLPCVACLALIVRALHWRLTETLPPFSFGFAELWAYLFAALETASGVGSLFLFLFLSRTLDRRPEARRHQSWVLARKPGVDVLIPTYNEDESILDRTILGALSQNYDNFRVFVLDDGRRDGLKALCRRRGVGYLTRADNAHGKAGNMNCALAHLREHGGLSEFIAVLDADFVAQPNFLTHALALFHNERVGCVQTPHHFYNPDPLQHDFTPPIAGRTNSVSSSMCCLPRRTPGASLSAAARPRSLGSPPSKPSAAFPSKASRKTCSCRSSSRRKAGGRSI